MIEAESNGEVRSEGLLMFDPRAVLFQASQGAAPSGWAVFTKRRGRLTGFLRGTSDDPDPLLVITPEGVVEFVDNRKGLFLVDFDRYRISRCGFGGAAFRTVRLSTWTFGSISASVTAGSRSGGRRLSRTTT